MHTLFRQFSFPGDVPSHVSPETPGSIHEGGELGYSLSHAFGAAFDNPDLIVACVVGDGESETGPLATSWHGHRFLNPAGDGAVLPILHLNGYKIANPAVLARIPDDELEALLRGYGYDPVYVSGSEPSVMHEMMAAALDGVIAQIRAIQGAARGTAAASGAGGAPRPELLGMVPRGDARLGSSPHATAACYCATWTSPASATMRCQSRNPARTCPSRPGCSAATCGTSWRATPRSATSGSSARTRPSPTG
jgi:xylulose-5-phosphate/fructose-6-phosphate phosphoketolase